MRKTLFFLSLLALVAVSPVHAAAPLEEHMLALVPELARSVEQGTTAEVLGSEAGSLADRTAQGWFTNLLSTRQGVTEISITGITSNEPVWSFLFLRPVTESLDLRDNTFVQSSVFREGGRTTLNLGYGYRRMAFDEKVLFGTNIFYDYEFPYDHQRMSVGGEIRTTVGEVNSNLYRALTKWKDVGGNMEERALGGYDVEVGLAVPYVPSAQMRFKHFCWNGEDNIEDLKGNTFSLTGSLYEGLSVEAGYTDYNSGTNEGRSFERFLTVGYNVSFGGNDVNSATKPRLLSTPYVFESMVDRRFEKVRRENRIMKARRNASFAVTVTGF